MTLPKIKQVRAWFTGGATAEKGAGGGDYHDQGANHWIDDHIATPMSKYRDYEQSRQSFGIDVLGTLVVEVEAENGQTGFAVSTAGEMGNDSNLLIVFYVQIMPDDFVMQLHRF